MKSKRSYLSSRQSLLPYCTHHSSSAWQDFVQQMPTGRDLPFIAWRNCLSCPSRTVRRSPLNGHRRQSWSQWWLGKKSNFQRLRYGETAMEIPWVVSGWHYLTTTNHHPLKLDAKSSTTLQLSKSTRILTSNAYQCRLVLAHVAESSCIVITTRHMNSKEAKTACGKNKRSLKASKSSEFTGTIVPTLKLSTLVSSPLLTRIRLYLSNLLTETPNEMQTMSISKVQTQTVISSEIYISNT